MDNKSKPHCTTILTALSVERQEIQTHLTHLHEADFIEVRLVGTVFATVDLRQTKGLLEVFLAALDASILLFFDQCKKKAAFEKWMHLAMPKFSPTLSLSKGRKARQVIQVELRLDGFSHRQTSLTPPKWSFLALSSGSVQCGQKQGVRHFGSSIINLYSVQLPQGDSVLRLLQGAGIPDEWIAFYRATMQHPIQYHSCFISYSSTDDLLARRLHADLQDHGVRCWFAPEDMKIGDQLRARIDEAIHLQDKLLLILSEHSIASAWVEDEVEAALEKEQQQQREVLFPVRLDESVMQTTQAWAAKLRRTRHIGDFTRWKEHDAYQQSFERLLRDLKKAHG